MTKQQGTSMIEDRNLAEANAYDKRWARSWGESWGRTQRQTATSIMLKHGMVYWLLLWNLPTYRYVRGVIRQMTWLLKGMKCEWEGDTESHPPIVFCYSERHGLECPKLGFFSSGKEAEDARSAIYRLDKGEA